MIAFIAALGRDQIDLLGSRSVGLLKRSCSCGPLVRRLVAATGPKGTGDAWLRVDIERCAGREQAENLLYIMFAHTERARPKASSSSAGSSSVRTDATTPHARGYDAIVEWGIPDHGALQRLTGIQSPTLVIQGDDDLMIPPRSVT